jgi:opacity protein-like surface antigen
MRFLIAAAATTLLAASAAHAADLDLGPLRGTGQSYGYGYGADLGPVADWSGVYVGGFGGYGQSGFDTKVKIKPFVGTPSDLRFSPKDGNDTDFGGFIGYNYQIDEAVLGVEADYTHTPLRGTSHAKLTDTYHVVSTTKLTDFGTVRFRAAYTVGAFMPFVTGGLAVGAVDTTATIEGGASTPLAVNLPLNKTTIAFGFTAGAGLDFLLTENIFVRGEYQYAYLDDFDGRKINLNLVRGGVGVKF